MPTFMANNFRLLIEIYGQCFSVCAAQRDSTRPSILDERHLIREEKSQDGVSVSLLAPEPRLHRLCKAPQTQDTAQRC